MSMYVVSIDGFPYSPKQHGGEVYLLLAKNQTNAMRKASYRYLKEHPTKSLAQIDVNRIVEDLRQNKRAKLFLVIIEGFKGTTRNRNTKTLNKKYLLDAKSSLSAQRKIQLYFMKNFKDYVVGFTNVIEVTKDITGQNPSRRI